MYCKDVDQKWQKVWQQENVSMFKDTGKKLYCLEMFSYPSGAKLHVGHWYNYAPADTWSRMKRMQGYEVFHPMGFDAFGLPAENYAIKSGIHPNDSTMKNISVMRRQLREMGAVYDWDHEIVTCMPEYYKWTQWLFVQLYKAGLAYKKEAPVNWCSKCNTVLANEQVENGVCERCGTVVERRKLSQWFFKITDYAEELLKDIDNLDWPELTKKAQKNWIGKSTGSEVKFPVVGKDIELSIFTTRVDTLYGVTCLVVAPESEVVSELVTEDCYDSVNAYVKRTLMYSEIERMSTERERTGVFTGAYAVNPINGHQVPIWIADYVIESHGTGCIMAVPAHDKRDYDFALRYALPIIKVIDNSEVKEGQLPIVDDGILVNSDEFSGISSSEARNAITEKLISIQRGNYKISYRLRDWLVSRQRYWGAPIPVVYCEDCGTIVLEDENLPVELPYDVEFTPNGESPLKKHDSFMHTICPKCGKPAVREADTLDTFVCSSWYYLRYPDANNAHRPFDTNIVNRVCPVDMYIGGKEHATMHLLYARFITKVLKDLGFVNFDEPFKKLVHQGIILGTDGNKMSKSKGNVVSPDEYIDIYGSDIFRMYIMFGFAYVEGGQWSDDGIKAIAKFFSRVEALVGRFLNNVQNAVDNKSGILDDIMNSTIKNVTISAENFQFNTAIARIMEFVNQIIKYEQSEEADFEYLKYNIETLIKLLAPFAPHFSEELWHMIGYDKSVHEEKWPVQSDNQQTKKCKLPIQLNGKVKCVIEIPFGLTQEAVREIAFENAVVKTAIMGKTIRKEVFVQDRIYNFVCS